GAVSGSKPAGFPVVGFESASAGGFPVAMFGSGLSASAIGSASAALGLTRSKIKQVRVNSRSKRSPRIADPPFFPRRQLEPKPNYVERTALRIRKVPSPRLKLSIPRKLGSFCAIFQWLLCRIGSRQPIPSGWRLVTPFTEGHWQFASKAPYGGFAMLPPL